MRTLFSSGKAHGLCVWPGGTSYRGTPWAEHCPWRLFLVRSNWSSIPTSLHTAFLDEYVLLEVRVRILVLPSYFSTDVGIQGGGG